MTRSLSRAGSPGWFRSSSREVGDQPEGVGRSYEPPRASSVTMDSTPSRSQSWPEMPARKRSTRRTDTRSPSTSCIVASALAVIAAISAVDDNAHAGQRLPA